MTKISDEKILKIKIDYILKSNTQQELADKLNITQWQLLEKIKDKSFTDDELLKIDKIFVKTK